MKAEPHKATQQQTKTYNSQLVLKTIYDRGQVSRADVARLTHLTRTTVSDLVAELQDRGLVQEVGHGPSVGGRSPILLSVVDDARHLICIDLANDDFCGAVVNLRNEILRTATLPVHSRGGDAALGRVYELIDTLLASADRPVLGIGLGTPGLVDTTNGVVLRAVNLEWRNLPLGRLLQDRYQLPVYVANDSQVAALAQYMFGDGQDTASLVLIKVGHGIGAGIVLDGHLYQGEGSGAGEIGHLVVVENGLPCRCGNAGCLETVASIPAIHQRALNLAHEMPHSLLNQLAPEPARMTLDVLLHALQAGDDAARRVVLEIGRFLGMAAAILVGTLNIGRIILVGSVTQLGAPLLEAIRQEMLRRSLPALAQATRVELGSMGANIVILGASALLLAREFGLSLAR
ncbi:MAG TPA: ROK family transcriptional regulator [Chloroflexia bacterium]|nr:ROK family transcriptional regulator [Chloroflexia bacterium]